MKARNKSFHGASVRAPTEEFTLGESPPEGVPIEASEAARYEGKYFNSKTIAAELAVREGALQAQVGGRWFVVRKIGPQRFRAQGAGPLSEFQLVPGPNGSPEFLVAEVWALRRLL